MRQEQSWDTGDRIIRDQRPLFHPDPNRPLTKDLVKDPSMSPVPPLVVVVVVVPLARRLTVLAALDTSV